MSVCGGWSLIKHETAGSRAITLWCHAWSCPDCFPHRMAALKKIAAAGNPTTFLTLTINPMRGGSVEERAQDLSNALKILIKRARRKFQKAPIEYFAVFEETKKGEPHLHILMRAPFIPQRWISAVMNELITSPIVDIRKIHGKRQVINYIAKYVAKGPKSFGSMKRYWASRGYDPHESGPDRVADEFGSRWYAVQRPLFMIAEEWKAAGMLVVADGDHGIFAPMGRRCRPLSESVPWRDILHARRAHARE